MQGVCHHIICASNPARPKEKSTVPNGRKHMNKEEVVVVVGGGSGGGGSSSSSSSEE